MSGKNRQYVIELDGSYYTCTGNSLKEIQGLEDIREDISLFTDLGGAVSRSMSVDAPYKYAEFMIRKNLQESGKFDEQLSILTHWKKKKDAHTTEIFFTAFSTRLYHQLLDLTKSNKNNTLIFPVYSILYKVLKHMRHHRPVAVIFSHDKFAEMIIGTRNNIFYAERCVAFDDSEEQISALKDMILTEIRNAETDNRIKVDKILLVTWIDSKISPEWLENAENKYCSMEAETLDMEGETYSVSFLKAARMMSGHESVSGPMEKASYYCQKSLPFINSFLLLTIALFFAGFMWYGNLADQLEKKMYEVSTKASTFQIKAGVSEVEYKDTFSFVKELDKYQQTTSLKQVLEDITEALSGQITADVLKADYDENILKIEIFAKTEALFDTAYKGYQNFLYIMKQKGYNVEESKFDTSIQDSQFLVVFNKKTR